MTSVDLHGVRHEDVRRKVIHFIEDNWFTSGELHIITGHSKRMKEIAIEVLEEYDLTYRTTDFLGRQIPKVITQIK